MCDIVEERAQQVKEKFGALEAYTDFQEMLARSDIEGVVNLTPIPMHGSLLSIRRQKSSHLAQGEV